METYPMRTACVIDLDAVRFNLERMHENLPADCGIMAVVKTNAYGHGAVEIAKVCEEFPYVRGFAAATAEEAYELRNAGIRLPILILGYVFPDAYEKLSLMEIRPAVFRKDQLHELSDAGLRTGRPIKVHVAVDTGMGRIGITPDDGGLAFVKEALSLEGIEVEGLFTHFARADEEAGSDFTNKQYDLFTGFASRIREELGFAVPIVHCANSATIITKPERGLDMARAGITLYGLAPSGELEKTDVPLKPVLSWYAHMAFCKEVPAGTPVSYGSTFVSEKPMRIGTVPVGYGDGYPRGLSGKGDVLICAKRARILGRVCMDQLMVDLTDIPEAKEGDRVVLIGSDGEETITAEELGGKSGRFNYELVSCITARVPRVFQGRRGGADESL